MAIRANMRSGLPAVLLVLLAFWGWGRCTLASPEGPVTPGKPPSSSATPTLPATHLPQPRVELADLTSDDAVAVPLGGPLGTDVSTLRTVRGRAVGLSQAGLSSIPIEVSCWSTGERYEVTSQTGGVFLLEVRGDGALDFNTRGGWRIIARSDAMERTDDYSTLIVVEARGLDIRIVDYQGNPVVGAVVQVRLSELGRERLDEFEGPLLWCDEKHDEEGRVRSDATSDETGLARFPSVWVGLGLEILVAHPASPGHFVRYDQQTRANELATRSASQSFPLVVMDNDPGERLCRLLAQEVVRGRVEDEAGGGVSGVSVVAGVHEGGGSFSGYPLGAATTEQDGSFEIAILDSWPSTFGLWAADQERFEPWFNAFQAYSTLGYIAVEREQAAYSEFTLRLEELSRISGEVVGEAVNENRRLVLCAVPAGAVLRETPTRLGSLVTCWVGRSGRFRLDRVPRGTYDLCVKELGGGHEYWFRGAFPAGSSGVLLELPDRGSATVSVSPVRPPQTGPGTVMLARVIPKAAEQSLHVVNRCNGARSIDLVSGNWPPSVPVHSDSAGRVFDGGDYYLQPMMVAESGGSARFEDVQPGLYVVGIASQEGAVGRIAPCASGVVEVVDDASCTVRIHGVGAGSVEVVLGTETAWAGPHWVRLEAVSSRPLPFRFGGPALTYGVTIEPGMSIVLEDVPIGAAVCSITSVKQDGSEEQYWSTEIVVEQGVHSIVAVDRL